MKVSLQRNTQRVSRELVERKRQFRKALALAEMTQGEFALRIAKVGPSYLSRFLGGYEVSQPLTEKVDAFIAKHLRAVA